MIDVHPLGVEGVDVGWMQEDKRFTTLSSSDRLPPTFHGRTRETRRAILKVV